MRVTVFGATGKIGRLVLDRLSVGGHQVVAFARTPAKLERTDLTVIQGHLSDPAAVTGAVEGSVAVISALGPSLKRSSPAGPLTTGTRTIVAAMNTAGVRRFIGLATPSLADPRDSHHWKHTVLPLVARLAFPNALTELKGMTAAVTGSELEYTIVRITNPTDKPVTCRIRAGFLGHHRIGSTISRADIAAFLVDQLTDAHYIRAMPAISN
jgi:putative NADH-flavin reductase